MAFRQRLYSIIPELRDLDATGNVTVNLQSNIVDIKDAYIEQLSNCGSLDELLTINPSIVLNYIGALENNIVSRIYPTSNTSSYVTQKLSILESVYSNLLQSSTQSSQ